MRPHPMLRRPFLMVLCASLLATGCRLQSQPAKPKAGTTIDVVCDVAAELMSVDRKQVSPQTRFVSDLKGDDLDMVEMVMELEEALDITIPDEAMEKLAGKFGESSNDFTLQQFADMVDQQRKNGSSITRE